MQFDKFDTKAKQAADHHHPAYDEQAWAKMEKLLDKHLPQKEDNRRRFLFFLLLFLGLAGGGLLIAKPWDNNKAIAAAEQTVQQKQTTNLPSTTATDKEKNSSDNTVAITSDASQRSAASENKTSSPDISVTKQPSAQADNKPVRENVNRHNSNSKWPGKKEKITHPVATATNDNPSGYTETEENKTKFDRVSNPETIVKTSNPVATAISTDRKQSETVVADMPVQANTGPLASESLKTDVQKNKSEAAAKINELTKSRNNNKKQDSFFFTLSTGPDVSFVGNNKLGTTKLFAGAGLGYTFNNRFTIRAGFYSGRKVYSALADAYHPPDDFYTYYPYLEKVDADCKVYEIPLSVSYNFSKSSKKSFFASAGISSYLMKTEKYNYFYKYYPTGPSLNKEWTIKNENKHFFSGLTLSGGYQRNLSKQVSLMVEPYIKLPLSGVGYGKVKLNSGGILFSIGIKPFK